MALKTLEESQECLRLAPKKREQRRPGKKASRGISPASAEQKAKARVCLVTGYKEGVDPAHLLPRSAGGCDHPDCTVGLRRDIHRLFDEGKLDLLPHLLAHGCWAELAHPILVHNVSPLTLLERLTGLNWEPVRVIN